MTRARYKLLGWTITLCAVAVAFRSIVIGPNPLLGAALGLLIMLGMLGFAFADWKLMDEYARQANTTAWYWGIIAGIVFWGIAVSLLALRLGPDHVLWAWGHQGSIAVFSLGGLSVLLVQGFCASIAMALWKLSKR